MAEGFGNSQSDVHGENFTEKGGDFDAQSYKTLTSVQRQ